MSLAIQRGPWTLSWLVTSRIPISRLRVDSGNPTPCLRLNCLVHKVAGRAEGHVASWRSVTDCSIYAHFRWSQTHWVPSTTLQSRCRRAWCPMPCTPLLIAFGITVRPSVDWSRKTRLSTEGHLVFPFVFAPQIENVSHWKTRRKISQRWSLSNESSWNTAIRNAIVGRGNTKQSSSSLEVIFISK